MERRATDANAADRHTANGRCAGAKAADGDPAQRAAGPGTESADDDAAHVAARAGPQPADHDPLGVAAGACTKPAHHDAAGIAARPCPEAGHHDPLGIAAGARPKAGHHDAAGVATGPRAEAGYVQAAGISSGARTQPGNDDAAGVATGPGPKAGDHESTQVAARAGTHPGHRDAAQVVTCADADATHQDAAGVGTAPDADPTDPDALEPALGAHGQHAEAKASDIAATGGGQAERDTANVPRAVLLRVPERDVHAVHALEARVTDVDAQPADAAGVADGDAGGDVTTLGGGDGGHGHEGGAEQQETCRRGHERCDAVVCPAFGSRTLPAWDGLWFQCSPRAFPGRRRSAPVSPAHRSHDVAMHQPPPDRSPTGYAPRLGTFSGTMLVVGGIIGAGIFLSPAVVAQRVGSGALTLTAWAIGAVVALIGAFVFGELGARRPRAGGTYVYLRDGFGPLPAFLYAWALFLIIGTGAIAAVGVTGATYLASLLGLDAAWARPLAAGAIILLTLLNVAGVRIGATVGNILTVLKLAAIAALCGAALLMVPSQPAPVSEALPLLDLPQGATAVAVALSAALVPVLFAFGGWQQTNAVAEELIDPARTLPKALVLGVLIVASAYLLVNVAYLRALGVEGLAASTAPAADAMAAYLGPAGRTLIAAGIVVSTVGFLGVTILMSARVYQAMAADGLFFRRIAQLHPRTRTPATALLAQGAVALALLFTGTYGQLLDYVVFADWIFFGTTAAALFRVRRRDRDARAPEPWVRVPLHPTSTLAFIGVAAFVVYGSIRTNPGNAVRGALLLALGLPVYAWWRRAQPSTPTSRPSA